MSVGTISYLILNVSDGPNVTRAILQTPLLLINYLGYYLRPDLPKHKPLKIF